MTRILFALFLFTVPGIAFGQTPKPAAPEIAATVNGETISLAQVDAVVRLRLPPATPLSASTLRRLRTEIVQEMIDDLLVKQFLRERGPMLEAGELEKHLNGLTVALQRQGKTIPQYARELGQSESQIRESLETTLRFGKYVDRAATDGELRKYYAANRELFDGATATISQIEIRVSPNAPPGEWTAARQKLAAVRAELLAGKIDFASAVKKVSTDPLSGSPTEVSPRDPRFGEAVSRVAFALKANELSEPFDTEFGVHLLRVIAKKPGKESKFESVIDAVRDYFADDLRERLIADLRKKGTISAVIP